MKPDSDLDREIRALLEVDPSPQFTARVRSRIDRAPAPAWRFGWTVLAAGAMAVAIVLAIVVIRTPQPSPNASNLANALDIPVKPAPATPEIAPVARTSKAVTKSKEPEFFISPGEAAAIQQLLRNGSVEQVPIAIVTIEPQPLPETQFAMIEPISIEPPKGDSQ